MNWLTHLLIFSLPFFLKKQPKNKTKIKKKKEARFWLYTPRIVALHPLSQYWNRWCLQNPDPMRPRIHDFLPHAIFLGIRTSLWQIRVFSFPPPKLLWKYVATIFVLLNRLYTVHDPLLKKKKVLFRIFVISLMLVNTFSFRHLFFVFVFPLVHWSENSKIGQYVDCVWSINIGKFMW